MVTIMPFEKNLTLDDEVVLISKGNNLVFDCSHKKIKRLNAYYQKLLNHWLLRWEREVYSNACIHFTQKREASRHFSPFQVSFTPKVDIISENLLSVEVEVWEYLEDRRKIVVTSHDLWNFKEGVALSPHKMLNQAKNLKNQMLSALKAEKNIHLYKDYLKRGEDWFSTKRLFLTKEGWGIFFPQATIAPPEEGTPHFFLKVD